MPTDPETKPHVAALMRAIEICGTQAELARRIAAFLGRPTVKQSTVSYWLRRELLLEAEWWPAIEHATGGGVTARDLRQDVFSRLGHGTKSAAPHAQRRATNPV